MKQFSVVTASETATATVKNLGRYELEELERAIHVRKNALMVEALNSRGIQARYRSEIAGDFNMICVYDPSGEKPGEWATLDECRRLIDTVANLPPAEAFSRWREKIEPVYQEPYTRADAIADMKRERAEARAAYEHGEISAEDLQIAWKIARTTLDNVQE